MEVQKIPKNIRQIGEIEDWIRIYIEDYAVTYIHRLNSRGNGGKRWGLLLGRKERTEHSVYLFLSGAMEVTEEEIQSSGGWDQIEETIRVRFPGSQIWGWFLCENEGQNVSEEWACRMFRRYFDREYQVLYWQREREADFYVSSIRGLERLKGYHIYYERNEEMQEYMILSTPHYRTELEQSAETVVENYRKIMQEKKPERRMESKREKTPEKMPQGQAGGIKGNIPESRSGGQPVFQYGRLADAGDSRKKKPRTDGKSYSFFHAASLACVFLIGIMAFYGRRDMQTSALVETRNGGETIQAEENSQTVIQEVPANIQPTEMEQAEGQSGQGEAAQSQEGQAETAQGQESQAETAQGQESQAESVQGQTEQAETAQSQEQTEASETAAQPETQDNAGETEADTRPDTYTVQAGDTLQKISIAVYGNDSMVEELCEKNNIDNPDYLFAGQVLQLP